MNSVEQITAEDTTSKLKDFNVGFELICAFLISKGLEAQASRQAQAEEFSYEIG